MTDIGSRWRWPLSVRLGFLTVIVLANLSVMILGLQAPTITASLSSDMITSDGGFASLAPLHLRVPFPYWLHPDDSVDNASPLVLREDGVALGPPHVLHEDIRALGKGRYSHWGTGLHFSASDNSDPRTNRRHYVASERSILNPTVVRALGLIDLAAALGVLGIGLARFGSAASKRRIPRSLALAFGVLACLAVPILYSTTVRNLTIISTVLLCLPCALYHLLRRSAWAGLEIGQPLEANRRRFDAGLAIVVVGAAAAFLYAGPVQLYPAPGWVDPSIYRGYFSHYAFNMRMNGITYFSERLAFVLPGILFFKTLSLDLAHFALALLPTIICLLALIVILSRFAGRTIVMATSILMVASALFVAAVGQGYVAGTVLASLLAGYAFLLKRPDERQVDWSSVAMGACFAVAIFTNPVSIFHIFGSLVAYVIVYRLHLIDSIRRGGWSLAGGVVVLLAFAVSSKILTGQFDFLSPSVKASQGINNAPFSMPLVRWLPHALRLACPLIFAACGLIVILRCSEARTRARQTAYLTLCWSVAALLIAGACVVTTDLVLGGAMLTLWFYTCHFLIYTAVIVAAMLELARADRWPVWSQASLLILCLLGAVVAIYGAIATQGLDPSAIHPIALVLFTGSTALALVWVTFSRTWSDRISVLPLGIVAVILLVVLNLNPDSRHVFVYNDPRFRDAALVTAEADRFIFKALDGRRPFFWFNANAFTRATSRPRDWAFPHQSVYPLWFEGPRLYNVLDQIWARYYTRALLDHEERAPIADSKPDWTLVLKKAGPKAIIVLSIDPEDGRRVAERAAQLFGAVLVLEDHELIARGSFAVHVSVLAVRDQGHLPEKRATATMR